MRKRINTKVLHLKTASTLCISHRTKQQSVEKSFLKEYFQFHTTTYYKFRTFVGSHVIQNQSVFSTWSEKGAQIVL